MYKKLTALMFAIAMVFAAALCAYADDLGFATDTALPDATFNTPYSTTITAQGGSGSYTYTFGPSAYVPSGLVLSTDGILSGTPQEGGKIYGNLNIVVTDTVTGETAARSFSLSIMALRLEFKIGANSFTFDNLPHTVTAEPYLDGNKIDGIDYTVKVDGEDNQTAPGSYPIRITVNTPGYRLRRADKSHMFINYNNNVNVEFSGGTEFAYTGGQKTPAATVKGMLNDSVGWIDLAHTIKYEGLDVSYSSDTPPTLPGTYRMTVTVTETGFSTPADNDTHFQILHNTVNFSLSDNSPFYQGQTWNRVYNPDQSLAHTATVKYVQNGTEYDAPVSGTYAVRITLDDEDAVYYSIGTISPASITVQQRTAAFTVTETEKTYTGSGLLPSIVSNDGLTANTDYTVTFQNTDGSDTAAYDLNNPPVNSGTYTYTIALTDGSSYTMTPITGAFTIKPVNVKFTLSPDTFSYDGNPKSPTLTTDPAEIADTAAIFTLNYTKNGSPATLLEAGEYDVSIVFTDPNNYTLDENSTKKITITETPADVVISNNEYTYDGSPHKADVSATGASPADVIPVTVTYTNQDTSDTKTYTQDDPPVNAGTYDISVTLPDGYSEGSVTGSRILRINKQTLTFSISKTQFPFTGSDIDPSAFISVSPGDTGVPYTVVYHKTPSEADLTALSSTGGYTAEIRLSEADSKNYTADYSAIGTLTVTEILVDISIADNSYTFEKDTQRNATVTAYRDSSENYTSLLTVTYKNQDTSDTKVYTTSDAPIHAGTYDILISLPEGYAIDNVIGSQTLVINPAQLAFNITAGTNVYTYDGTAHTAEITSSPAAPDGTFSVKYVKQGTSDKLDSAVNSGAYDIEISVDDPDYARDDSSASSFVLTINPRDVLFIITDTSKTWTGTGLEPSITVDTTGFSPTMTLPDFSVTYTNQDISDTTVYDASNLPVDTGVYDIHISVSDNFNDTTPAEVFTITDLVTMNLGNSPAAMIYKDTTHSSDPDWQSAALEYLKLNRQFSSEYLPENCRTGVTYPLYTESALNLTPAMGSADQLDFDTDPNTVLVPYSIDNFTDPGLSINGVSITGTLSDKVLPGFDDFKIDGLYRVSYTDGGTEIASRFVAVVGLIGDATYDEVVNAIDANRINTYAGSDAHPIDNVTHARVWDVNKDGSVSSADADAVLSRFKTKLVPYYPWLDM